MRNTGRSATADGPPWATLHGEERLDPVGRPGRGQIGRVEPEHVHRAFADQRGDPGLPAAPSFVDDVRVVDDEDIGATTEHELRVPQRRRRVPFGQDRRVGWQCVEDRVDVGVGASIEAAIGPAPVDHREGDREGHCGATDDGSDIEASQPRRWGVERASLEHPRRLLESYGYPDGEHQPRHEQVVLEPQVRRPDVDVRDEDRHAQQAEGRSPSDEHDQADQPEDRQDHGRPGDEQRPERTQRADHVGHAARR